MFNGISQVSYQVSSWQSTCNTLSLSLSLSVRVSLKQPAESVGVGAKWSLGKWGFVLATYIIVPVHVSERQRLGFQT